MAIGDHGNNSSNGNSGRLFENTYYSRFRIKNYENGRMLNVYYRSGLMYLEISKYGENYKVDPIISICLSPMKAYLLTDQIKKFLEYRKGNDIDPKKAFGVNTGMGEKVSYIGFHTRPEDKAVLITIGKIDGNGNILDSDMFILNVGANYALEWDDIEAMKLQKAYDEDAEIMQLLYCISDFARFINGAAAYSVADITRYDQARVLKKMDPIYDKLGIERRNNGSGNSNYSGSNNFLDNAGSTTSNHTSYENIEDMLDE